MPQLPQVNVQHYLLIGSFRLGLSDVPKKVSIFSEKSFTLWVDIQCPQQFLFTLFILLYKIPTYNLIES